MNRPHKLTTVAFLLLLSIGLSSCVVWDFVRVRYENVTGYFNTYYNAKTLFDEAVDDIIKEEDSRELKIEGMNPLLVNVSPPAMQKFEKVIDKCSKILSGFSDSKWVDNALLLIGKSYYYRSEYGRAERKFRELMESFPQSNLYADAQLWLGKSLFMMERDEDARKTIEQAILRAKTEKQTDVLEDAYFTLGDMALFLSNQNETIDYYKMGVSVGEDERRKARTQYMLAKLEEKRGNKEAARKAYLRVLDYTKDYKLQFNSEIQYVRLSRELGDYDAAFRTLVRMLEIPKYLEYDAQIQLQVAHTLAASGDVKNAIEQYRWVDTTFRGKPEASEGYYSVARLYEYKMKDYDNAAENYGRAKLEFPGSEFAFKGGRRAEDFVEYHKLRAQMFEMDTLLFYALNPDSLFVHERMRAYRDSLDLAQKIRSGYDPNEADRERQSRLSRRRPHGRNTGKFASSSRMQSSGASTAQQQGAASGASTSALAGANQPLYRRLNMSEVRPDSVSKILASLRYEMGNVMYFRLQNIDSARFYYNFALQDSIGDYKAAHAYFTLAQMCREEHDSLKAEEYERLIMDRYATTPFGLQLRAEHNLPLPPDSVSMAITAYSSAANLIERGQHEQGIKELRKVIERYPNSDQSIRARLAIGLTFERDLKDRENMLKEYRTLAKDYSSSPFAQRAKDVLASIDAMDKEKEVDAKKKAEEEEKERIRKESEEPELKRKLKTEPIPPALKDTSLFRTPPPRKDPTQDPDFPLNPSPTSQPPRR